MTDAEESHSHEGGEPDQPADAPEQEQAASARGPNDEPGAEREPSDEPRPAETFKQGLGLLWKAARSTAEEIRREVDKGRVGEALQQAGRDLEHAATQASSVVEQLIGKLSPPDPKTQPWPNSPAKEHQDEQQGDDGPSDGGTTEDGERRDMRIQIDPDDES